MVSGRRNSIALLIVATGLAVSSVAWACTPTRNFVVTPEAGNGGPIVATGFFDCGTASAAVTTCPATGTQADGLLRSTESVPIGYQYDLCGIAVARSVSPTGTELNPVYAADGCKPVYGGIAGGDAPLTGAPRCVDGDDACLHMATYLLRHSSAQQCGPATTSTIIGDVTYIANSTAGEGALTGLGDIPATLAPGAYEICVAATGAIGITPEDTTLINAGSATAYNLYGYYVMM